MAVLAPLGALYGRALLVRRRRIESNPSAQCRLLRPVISVGNLSVGGSGKTPFVRWLAEWLVSRGERPSILSRGYRRTSQSDEPVIVSDGDRILADLATSGDEPLMIARSVREAVVVVDPDRYRAGTLAESRLGCTVHLLDDGFQHVRLRRDINLLLVEETDLADRVLPAGRLREPLAAARSADALLWSGLRAAQDVAAEMGVSQAFDVRREVGPVRIQRAGAEPDVVQSGDAIVALAAIARPERFFEGLEGAGFDVRARLAFRDHHPYTTADVRRIARAFTQTRASLVVTTEKDLVRLAEVEPLPFPLGWQPLDVRPHDVGQFTGWIMARLAWDQSS